MEQDDQAAELAGAEQRGGDHALSGSTRWDGRPAGGVDLARDALDRGRDLAEHRVVRIGVAAALLAVVGWWFMAGNAPGRESSGSQPFTAGGTTIAFASPTTPSIDVDGDDDTAGLGGDLVVHAAGAVVSPGVYRLPAGSRVDDLILAAGGLAVDADVNRLNLAEVLSDGERVYVRHVGEAETPAVEGVDGSTGSGGTSTGGSSDAGAGATPPGETAPRPIDINEATLDQLDELPGVGPTTAQAIVSHRDQNGPFQSVDELLEVRGIGPAKLEQIRPLVIV